jgi:16S rRNA (cytidine1402-2'-O)-methyltransferase
MPATGTLYCLPVPLSENALHTIPEEAKQKAITLKYFFVEELKTARRFLKAISREVNIDEIRFEVVNEHTSADTSKVKEWLKAGHDVGLMSEAGCPAVADPGSAVVRAAHQVGAEVIPYTGPNSILLALIASGLQGQRFQFVGYLPVKPNERSKAIRELETESQRKQQTQIFIETPYRNNNMIEDLCKNCKGNTLLTIGVDITGPEGWIKTKTIGDWNQQRPDIHKRPAVFLILAS